MSKDDFDLSDLSFDFGTLESVNEAEVGISAYTDEDKFPEREPNEDPALDAEEELDAIQAGFRARAAKEEQRLNTWVTSGHYAVIVFATSAQRVAFLEGSEWGDSGTMYLDGCLLAERMGIDIPETPEWRQARVNADFGARALDAYDE